MLLKNNHLPDYCMIRMNEINGCVIFVCASIFMSSLKIMQTLVFNRNKVSIFHGLKGKRGKLKNHREFFV